MKNKWRLLSWCQQRYQHGHAQCRQWMEQQKIKKRQAHRKVRQKEKAFATAAAKNPYLQSKALWNDLYGGLQTKLENSYRIIFILSIVIVVAIIGFVVIAGETKVKSIPFIVHGDEVFTASDVSSNQFQKLKPKLATYFAKQFIRNARSVSTDGMVNARHKIAAFSLVTGEATDVLNDFYAGHDPNRMAQHAVIGITITSILRESANTVDVRWREDWRSVRSGRLLHSTYYIAQLTYAYQAPSGSETILRNNPLGFYVTYLSWSRDQTT